MLHATRRLEPERLGAEHRMGKPSGRSADLQNVFLHEAREIHHHRARRLPGRVKRERDAVLELARCGHARGVTLHAFEGSMLFVSHDRTFLRGLATKVLDLSGGGE